MVLVWYIVLACSGGCSSAGLAIESVGQPQPMMAEVGLDDPAHASSTLRVCRRWLGGRGLHNMVGEIQLTRGIKAEEHSTALIDNTAILQRQ